MVLDFQDDGTGDPPLVLVHGWTCDRSAMAPVADAFRTAHLCRSLDLLGHGKSPRSSDYSIAAQAKAVLASTPAGAVLIGHSMGAQIAVEAAVQSPEKVRAVVLLDPAPLVRTATTEAACAAMADRLQADDIAPLLRGFIASEVEQADDAAAVVALGQVMAAMEPGIARACWQAISDWDGPARLAVLACPALMIVAPKTLNRPADVLKINKGLMTGQVVGARHMLQFEVMPQITAMIRRFFALKGL